MLKVILEGLPREIADLLWAVQEEPELAALRRKQRKDRTADEQAKLDQAFDEVCPTVPVYTDKEFLG